MFERRARLGWIAGLAACLALPACQEVGNPYYGGGPALYDSGVVVVQEPGYGYGRPYPGPGYGRGYDRGFDRGYGRNRDFDRQQRQVDQDRREFRQERRVEQDRREFRQERREDRQEQRRDNRAQDALRAVQQRDNNAQQEFYRSQGIR